MIKLISDLGLQFPCQADRLNQHDFAFQDGEHFVGQPSASRKVRFLVGSRQVQPEGQASLGRRRRLQELLQGRAGQEGEDLHQRLVEERLPPEVHEQVHSVTGPGKVSIDGMVFFFFFGFRIFFLLHFFLVLLK